MKYRVMVSVNIFPLENGQPTSTGNSLYHQQQFEIGSNETTRFSQIAPTIDAVYDAIQQAVEAAQ